MGWAALVGVLCATILVGLSLARSTVPMAGVAHSERGPSTYSASTSTTSPSATLTPDPEPSDIASPRGSSHGPGGLPAVPLAAVADPQAVVGGVVRQGAFCARAAVAQIGNTSSGTKMICSYGDGEDQPRWRAIYVEQAEPTTKKPSTAKPTDEEPQTEESEEPEDEESTTAAPTTITKPPKTTGTPASTQAFSVGSAAAAG
jgi:hypothetical protein